MVNPDNGAAGGHPVRRGPVDHDATMSPVPVVPHRLDQLIADNVGDVAAYCRWRCGSPEDAVVAISEVFVVAGRRVADVPEGDAARVWLLATARRVITHEHRGRVGRHRLVERLRLVEPDESVQWPVEFGPGGVADTLRQLGPADREILLLAEWEGLTSAEIGTVVGCLAASARSRLHRARRHFRVAYNRRDTASSRLSSLFTAMTTLPPSGLGRDS